MDRPISDLPQLLTSMEPVLNEGIYVYATVSHDTPVNELSPIATIREREGITVVVPEDVAIRHGLPIAFRAAWITLTVHSDLQAVGLTAAFASVLSQAGVSCNVIAGTYHDHIFVPIDLAQEAMAALQALQRQTQ